MRYLAQGPRAIASAPGQDVLPMDFDWGAVDAPGGATYHYIDESGLPQEEAQTAWQRGVTLDGRPIRDELASAMSQWMSSVNSPSIAGGSLFFRNRYTMTTNVYDQMMQCIDAVEYDEVLSSVGDATEGLAFQRVSFEQVDQDQEDIWNQIGKKLKLTKFMGSMWRELYKVSQVYVGVDWEEQVLKVRTPTIPLTATDEDPPQGDQPIPGAEDLHPTGLPRPGPKKRARRKQFAITAPSSLTIWDPTKVLPVGQLMFGKERFAYIASQPEHDAFMSVFEGKGTDPLVLKMFEGPYIPTPMEMEVLSEHHKGPTNKAWLWLFKKDAIFRHTLTKADYERFAALRFKSVLPVLDMKAHLRASDRATLIGATNFIIVLKRGSDKFPARPGEVEQLRDQSRVVARMPILVGDHRLSVEIVTPQTNFVLDEKRYDVLNQTLIMRGLSTFKLSSGGRSSGGSGGGGGSQSTDDEIARGIENRRNDLADSLWEHLVQATVDKNEGVLTEVPNISFHPKRVVINLDFNIMKLVLQLRDRGDISRETELEEFQMDQSVEYVRRKREKGIDDVFKSSVPFSSPSSNPFAAGSSDPTPGGGGPVPNPSQSGATGGRPVGGGGPGSGSAPAGAAAPKTPATPN